MKREYFYSTLIKKKLKKLKSKELANVMNKVDETASISDLDHYKNLRNVLKKYKRVHVNNSYIILFFGEDNIVYFVDYEHHDKIYDIDKKTLEKYENLIFE